MSFIAQNRALFLIEQNRSLLLVNMYIKVLYKKINFLSWSIVCIVKGDMS